MPEAKVGTEPEGRKPYGPAEVWAIGPVRWFSSRAVQAWAFAFFLLGAAGVAALWRVGDGLGEIAALLRVR